MPIPLSQLHATLAMVKAVTTGTASPALEKCRLACGGHGYSGGSGIPRLSAGRITGAVTAEGEFTVLLLQGAR